MMNAEESSSSESSASPAGQRQLLSILPFVFSLLLFLALGAYQLRLPGLHYDEAKEAGLNAMQLVTWQPLTAFRDATIQIGPWRLPLMMQDYIGSLNVLLATPFLALGGVKVVALRGLPLLIAALTLLLTWRVAWRLGGPLAAAATALLLAVNPSFVFWSRQGIFVTNLTALLFMASLLTGLRWWGERRPRDLWLTALFWGLGIYAKLLFVWAIGAMGGVVIGKLVNWAIGKLANTPRSTQYAVRNTQSANHNPSTTLRPSRKSQIANPKSEIRVWLTAAACFLVPLLPLLIFNLRTGGTLTSIFGNLGHSYYGVDNTAYLANLAARLGQLRTLLRGDHLWYLGGLFANPWAPWIAGGLVVAAVALRIGRSEIADRRLVLSPVEGSQIGNRRSQIADRRSQIANRKSQIADRRSQIADRRSQIADRKSQIANRKSQIGESPRHRVTVSPCHRVTSWSPLLPVALLALMVAQSAFTVSDLFITHYALLLPLIPLAGGLAVGALWTGQGSAGAEERGSRSTGEQNSLCHSFASLRTSSERVDDEQRDATQHQRRVSHPAAGDASLRPAKPMRGYAQHDTVGSALLRSTVLIKPALALLALLAALAWAGGDLWTTLRYHRALAASGGHASHSDAIYDLADYLDSSGAVAPLALDWGIDAQVRFLTANRVQPIELFGYADLDAPDAGFAGRVGSFMEDPDSLYLAHTGEDTVFHGRVEALAALAQARGLQLHEAARFAERSGRPLFVVYGLVSPR